MGTDLSKLIEAINRVGIQNVSLLARMTGISTSAPPSNFAPMRQMDASCSQAQWCIAITDWDVSILRPLRHFIA